MSKRAAADLWDSGFVAGIEAAIEETETYAVDLPDAWDRGFADGCLSVRNSLRKLLAERPASGMEARRAIDAEGGVVHDSPVRDSGDAQEPSTHSFRQAER